MAVWMETIHQNEDNPALLYQIAPVETAEQTPLAKRAAHGVIRQRADDANWPSSGSGQELDDYFLWHPDQYLEHPESGAPTGHQWH